MRLIGNQWTFVLDGTLRAVPIGEGQWSEDGKYSACIWGGQVKCFLPSPGA